MQTQAFLEAAVTHLNAMEPAVDLVLATGDLVEAGTREEYELLVEILEPLSMPVYMIPGNHDERQMMGQVLREHSRAAYLPEEGFLNYCVDLGPLRLVALDTVVQGEPGGLLCQERLQWLDARLAEEERPTIVMQHHPPFVTGMSQMDDMGLEGSTEEEEIIARYPHVERVLCGHLHRGITRRFGGTIASTCPSTAHAVELDLREPGRLGVVREPPACALHLWRDGALVSHVSYIGDYGPTLVVEP